MKKEIYNTDGSLRDVIYESSGRTEIYDARGSCLPGMRAIENLFPGTDG